jgi:hypothetical protein
MRARALLFICMLVAVAAIGIAWQANGGQANPGIARSVVVASGTPATCTAGQVVFVTGVGIYECTATNTWSQLASGGSAITATAIFGDGSDGAQTFDGTTTILGLVPSASTYTLTRDIYLASSTINNGVTILTAGFKIFCNGTLTNNGTIQANGQAGSAGGAGVTAGSATFTGSSGSGGTGGNNAVGNSGTNSSSTFAPNIGAVGGAGGAATNAGGAAGIILTPAATMGNVHGLPQALSGSALTTVDNASAIRSFSGGTGGGGGGSSAVTATGGTGGAGGFIVGIYAKTLNNGSGTIEALGGAGAAGSGTALNAGGGGGGGGGVVILVYNTLTAGTISVAGGTPGAAFNSGAPGATGSTGLLVEIPNNN